MFSKVFKFEITPEAIEPAAVAPPDAIAFVEPEAIPIPAVVAPAIIPATAAALLITALVAKC